MRRAILLSILLLALGCTLNAQGGAYLTIDECIEKAYKNYPLIRQYDMVAKSSEYTISNAKRNWLPKFSLQAQATYQSEVPGFPSELSSMLETLAGISMGSLNKDQYAVALQLEQIIWDGGYTSAKVKEAEASYQAEKSGLEVDMYGIRERVKEIYFGILLLQEKLAEAELFMNELDRNYERVKGYMNNGMASKRDLDLIKVEKLTVLQKIDEINASSEAFKLMLGVMVGSLVDNDVTLVKPDADVNLYSEIRRPELTLLDAKYNELEAKKKALNASVIPTVGAFVQGAYGNPGPDIFKAMSSDKWSPYMVAGIKLQWNIGNFYTKSNNMSIINMAQQRVENQKDVFLYNINLSVLQQQSNIRKMKNIISKDDDIIELRRSIREKAEIELENGVITVKDMLTELNNESRANQTKISHEIELLKSIYDLKNTTNNW